MPCPRTQQANLPACSPQPPLNAERQAEKLWIPFFKVFRYDSARGLKPRSTDYAIASVIFWGIRGFTLWLYLFVALLVYNCKYFTKCCGKVILKKSFEGGTKNAPTNQRSALIRKGESNLMKAILFNWDLPNNSFRGC